MMHQNLGKRRQILLLKQIKEFLEEQPGMRMLFPVEDNIILQGFINLNETYKKGYPKISESYRVKLILPRNFPSSLPQIFELNGKIPRLPENHINDDGSLCVGSPLTIARFIIENPTLLFYVNKCLIPYLYAASLFIKDGIPWVFDELGHGSEGLLEDYSKMFQLYEKSQIEKILEYLSYKRRIANKKPCPCRCGKRFGKCKIGLNANKYRVLGSRNFFDRSANQLINQR